MIDTLARVLFDAGDACILATPYYNAFDEDFRARGDVSLIGVCPPEGKNGELEEVEAIAKELDKNEREGGPKVKAVLVTNPHNPLGQLQSADKTC